MPVSPRSFLPARFRQTHRIVTPVILTTSLIAGSLAVVAVAVVAPSPASAAGGTFTIGATPTQLSQPIDPEIGALAPSADAATNGMFGTQAAWPIIPLHATIARNGDLVSYGTPLDQPVQGGLEYDVWDPATGFGRTSHLDSPSMHDYDSFCNAIVEIPDGRLVMVGGNSASTTMIYDTTNNTQTMGADLNFQRWYATTLRLPDNRLLVIGGGNTYYGNAYLNPDNDGNLGTTPEIGTGTGAWTQLTGADSNLFGARDNRYWYPRAFNGPNGTVVGMSGGTIWSLSTDGNGSVQQTGTLPFNPKASGSQVMYAPGKILVAGGGQPEPAEASIGLADAAIVDVNGATPVVTTTAPMHAGRNWLNLTVLPNGEVFANGGTIVGINAGDANSTRQSEIWNPATGTWRTAATAQRTRTYHSTSLVLPSGAVFTGGGGAPGPEDNLNAELYYPAYLFTKNDDGSSAWASRPAITAIAGAATYGGTVDLTIGDGRAIGSASLISLPAVTHSQNTDQRRVPLDITQNGGTVSAALPASVNTMPPGDYELTVVDTKGVPSPAQIVTIRPGAAGLVTTASDNTDANANANPMPGMNMGSGAGAGTGAGTGTGTGSGTGTGAPAASTPLTIDTSVGLEPASNTKTRVTHVGSSAVLRTVGATSSASSKKQSSWIVRPGLASAAGMSFESVDKPGYYLAAPAKGSGAVKLVKNDRSKKFAARATFVKVGGNTGANTSFTTWSKRSLYLKVTGSGLSVGAFSGSKAGRAASTFLVKVGYAAAPKVSLTTGRSVGFEAVGKSGYRIGETRSGAALQKVGKTPSAALRKDTSWVVRSSKGAVSFESVDRPGYYLAAPAKGSGALSLIRGSAKAFSTRTAFKAVKGVTEGDISFVLKARPGLYVQLSKSKVVVKALTRGNGAAATFVVRSGLAPAPTK